MNTRQKADAIALSLLEDTNGYFANIKPSVVDGMPELAYHYVKQVDSIDTEVFLYYVDGDRRKRKFFIEICVRGDDTICSTCGWIELRADDKNLDNYLLKTYKPYYSVQELLLQVIQNYGSIVQQFPQRNHEIVVIHNTDYGQGNVGYTIFSHDMMQKLANIGTTLRFVVQIRE